MLPSAAFLGLVFHWHGTRGPGAPCVCATGVSGGSPHTRWLLQAVSALPSLPPPTGATCRVPPLPERVGSSALAASAEDQGVLRGGGGGAGTEVDGAGSAPATIGWTCRARRWRLSRRRRWPRRCGGGCVEDACRGARQRFPGQGEPTRLEGQRDARAPPKERGVARATAPTVVEGSTTQATAAG